MLPAVSSGPRPTLRRPARSETELGARQILDLTGRRDLIVFAREEDNVPGAEKRFEFCGTNQAHAPGGIIGSESAAAQTGAE